MTYSKSKINQAGQLWAEHLRAALDGTYRIGDQKSELQESIQIIDWWRSEHSKPLLRVRTNLLNHLAEEGKPVVTQRLKKLPTLLGKLLREPGMKLARMEDIGGVRAVLPNQDAAYRVARRLRKNWTITRFRDYVARPKPDGYRALHLINRNQGRLIEVQLRTPSQDSWANIVEGLARIAGPGLKFGGGPQELQEFLAVLSDLGAQRDQGLEIDPATFARMEELQESVDILLERADNEP